MLCSVDNFVKEMQSMNVPMTDVDQLVTSYLTIRSPEVFQIHPEQYKVDPILFKKDDLVGYLVLNKKEGFMRTLFLDKDDFERLNEDEDRAKIFVIPIHEIYKRLYN